MDNLTVVVPFWNGHDTIRRLLDSLPEALPVVVVDDHSDEPLRLGREGVRVIRPDEKGYFSGAVNVGLDACETDVLILNQDAWLEGTAWFDLLAEKRGHFAMVGERIKGKHPAWPKGYIHGTFMFMRRDAIQEVGPLNAEDYPLWGSTCEWQLRATRKGYRALPLASVPGFHHERRGNFGSAMAEMLKRQPDKRPLFVRTPPLVSVVVPCHDHGQYLPDLVNSLVGGETCLGDMPGQTFQSFEVIIVDDASTDNTEEWCRYVADAWKGIRYIRREQNGGTAAANNTGIEVAHGQYIAMINADDMMEPWRLESLYRATLRYPHHFIYDDARLFKDGKRRKHWQLADYDFEAILQRNNIHAGIFFPKAAWVDVGGYPEIMRYGREDWAMNVALGVKGWCGVHVARPGYLYRREGQNRTLRNTTPHWRRFFANQLAIELFPEIYGGERPMGCCSPRKNRRKASSPARPANVATVGKPSGGNMIQVEYVGRSAGDMTWYGPVTRRTYLAGGVTRLIWVDERDLATGRSSNPGLLEISEGGRRIFVKAEAPMPPVPSGNLRMMQSQPKRHSPAPPPTPPASGTDLQSLPGVGDVTAQKLAEAGFTTIQAIVDVPPGALVDGVGISLNKANKIWEAANALIA